MSFNAPSPPDPVATANAQGQMNKDTATWQQELNMVNQTNPYGRMEYRRTGTNPDGSPIFESVTTLNPAEQQLFDTAVGTQQKVGRAAGGLIDNLGDSLTRPPDLNNSALTQQMMGWGNNYMQPLFNQQQSNLDSKLAAQGITEGSEAYNNAQNLQSRNVNNAWTNLFSTVEPMAYQQALQTYQAPIQTLGTLLGLSQPGSFQQSQTPSAQIQPPNYEALVQQNYQSELGNYQNTIAGMFGVGAALAGGWAKASDMRLKHAIEPVGQLYDGTPIYRYMMNGGHGFEIGVMAQEIRHTTPDAVHVHPDGHLMVDYKRATDRAAEIGRSHHG